MGEVGRKGWPVVHQKHSERLKLRFHRKGRQEAPEAKAILNYSLSPGLCGGFTTHPLASNLSLLYLSLQEALQIIIQAFPGGLVVMDLASSLLWGGFDPWAGNCVGCS